MKIRDLVFLIIGGLLVISGMVQILEQQPYELKVDKYGRG